MTVYLKAYIEGQGTVNNVAEPFQFPGGEWHLRNLHDFGDTRVTWIADVRGADPNDLVKAALLGQHARDRRMGDGFVLMLPYVPAARADRGTPLGVAAYAQIVNSLHADQVIGVDLHSRPAWDWTVDLAELPATAFVDRALMGRTYDAVIAPDKGALPRAEAMAEHLGCLVVRAEKERDFATGKITGMRMLDATPANWRYLVADDICDGGGTFIGLAQMLNLPKEQVDLWVTHGIFSGKAEKLHDHFGRIYTTDSHPGHSRIHPYSIVPVFPTMFKAMQKGLVKHD
ncbi:ribose-phosphate pyrophosphokinase [Mycobacteroides abscessus subsp. abscessus]|uniref:phosphoribosyltransferase family protein n=1 Tax=Mycobacteroides abscessus TaxID=36809 RepID=UPI00092BCA8F|nr:phosphoribosyltransferase family protein [Mycobacteroides abscessus]SIL73390.1 ribose-phosphate pyrophosphokinase [Mycobacteroides abscessus subsp. abscessus]